MFSKLKNIINSHHQKNYISEERSKIVALFCTFCAWLYHILIFFVFIKLKIYPMVFYNIFSITLFSVLLARLNHLESYVALYILSSLEVIPHQILAEYYLGSYAGFHFFILLMGLIQFLVFRNRYKILIPFSFFTSLLFIIMENCTFEPKYQISRTALNALRLTNITLSVVIIFFMILIFTYVVLNFEQDLQNTNQTLTNEIEMASVIQKSFFKQDLSAIKAPEIACFNKPMAGVSGDIYDFYKTGSRLDGFGIFDVSGHGISSSLVTMLVKNIITKEFYEHRDLDLWEVMNHINDRVIEEKGDIQNYLTGILVRTINENLIELVSAGHPMPILYHADTKKCEHIRQDKYSVGAIGIKDFPVFYNSILVHLKEGDEVVFYSDGITDIENEKGNPFGISNLMKTIEKIAEKNVNDQVDCIVSEIKTFLGDREQNDDLTFIIFKKSLNSKS